MTLARATISGKVYRAPEKRFTSNNIPITGFTLNISDTDEILIRVNTIGNLAESVAQTIGKGDEVVVEGRMQNTTATAEDGTEKRVVEVDASSVMKISGGIVQPIQGQPVAAKVAKTEEFNDELIGEDEIPF